jgi:hypothetical protein
VRVNLFLFSVSASLSPHPERSTRRRTAPCLFRSHQEGTGRHACLRLFAVKHTIPVYSSPLNLAAMEGRDASYSRQAFFTNIRVSICFYYKAVFASTFGNKIAVSVWLTVSFEVEHDKKNHFVRLDAKCFRGGGQRHGKGNHIIDTLGQAVPAALAHAFGS